MTDNNLKNRLLLFLFGCILSRLVLVVLAKYSSDNILYLMGIGALCISFGFMYIFISGTRKSGPETFGEKIWWNDFRPIHAFLYLLFAVLVFTKWKHYAWIVLLVDVLIGLGAFLYFHQKNGDFQKAFTPLDI